MSLYTYLEVTVGHLRDVFTSGFHRIRAGNDYRSSRTTSSTQRWIPSNRNRVRCCVEIPRTISDHFTWLGFSGSRWQSSIPWMHFYHVNNLREVKWNDYQNSVFVDETLKINQWTLINIESVVSYAFEGNRFLKVTYLCFLSFLTSRQSWTTKQSIRKLYFIFRDQITILNA